MEDNAAFHLVDARDGIALLVGLRITARYQHHTDGSTLVECNGALVEVSLSHTLKQVYDVALQAQHHALGLRITHTTVVFNDVRLWGTS